MSKLLGDSFSEDLKTLIESSRRVGAREPFGTCMAIVLQNSEELTNKDLILTLASSPPHMLSWSEFIVPLTNMVLRSHSLNMKK